MEEIGHGDGCGKRPWRGRWTASVPQAGADPAYLGSFGGAGPSLSSGLVVEWSWAPVTRT